MEFNMFKKTALASAMLAAITAPMSNAQDDQLEEVIVTGIRGSLTKALDIKRESTQIVDSIVAEDIGKFPDNNVVEALQRVTGVQTTARGSGEVSGISIRGLTDVHTTVNGRDVYTGAGRAVALQDIPASLLSNVMVYKTRSADQVERGIAGSIDVKTHRPFDFSDAKVVVAARGIYADQTDKVDPNVSALFSNRWELAGGGEVGALVNISYAETHYRDDTITAGAAMPYFGAESPSGFAPYQLIDNSKFPTQVWQPGLEFGLPHTAGSTLNVNGTDYEYLLMRDAVFGASYTGLRKRPGASVSLQWAPNDELEITAEGFYTGFRNSSQNSMWFVNTMLNQNGNIEIPLVYEGTNVVKEHQGRDNSGFQSGDYSTGKTDSYLYALGATWTPADNVKVKSEIIYQDSEYTTDFFAMRFEPVGHSFDIDYNDRDGVLSLNLWDNPATAADERDMTNLDNWRASGMWDNGGGNQGDSVTFTTDVEWELDGQFIQTLKVGGRYEQRSAQEFSRGQESWANGGKSLRTLMQDFEAAGASNSSGLIFTTDDYFDGRANIFDRYISANGDWLLKNAEAVREVYNLEREQEATHKNFTVDEDSAAVYITSKFKLSDAISGEFGVRYVDYQQDIESWSETAMNTNVYDHDVAEGKADKFLPSLVLNWNITEDLVGRFAYTQTLRMPEYNALNPLQYFQDPLTTGSLYGTGSGGNPALKPTESTNYDLSLEWYFAPGSSIYGALFQREIDGLVIGGKKIVNRTGNDGVTRDYVLTTGVNAADGELSGIEIGLVYFPENLPALLDGFGMQASFTALDSSQKTPTFDDVTGAINGYVDSKMSGVSDSSYSLVLAYEKERFGARLSYVWREKFYTGNEASIFANPIQFWNRPEQDLSFQLNYDVTDELSITFDGTNLLDDVYQSYYGEGNQNLFNFGSAIYSKTYAVGVRYSF
jgi:iron complex outermembrane receptor protein